MPKISGKQHKRVNVSTTLLYSETDESVQDILLKSFAFFLEKEAKQGYNEADGWLLIGGTSCTLQ